MRVVVVGSGLLGVSSAYFLAREGCEVTVVDRAAGIAQATSFANAGMLTPSMADPWNAPGVLGHLLHWLGREDAPMLLRLRALPSLTFWGLNFLANASPARFRANMGKNLRLASYSLQVMRELRAALTLSYDERSNGTLKIFRDAKAFAEAGARNRTLAELGLKLDLLTSQQAVLVEPALAPIRGQIVGAVHCAADESGDARKFTLALAEQARVLGATFQTGTDVIGFAREGERLSSVVTDRSALPADAVVVAAGCWSPLLLRRVGISMPVRPVKGYSITVNAGAWQESPRLPVNDDALHAAITPLGDRLRVAGTAEFAGYDTRLSPGRIENLFQLLLSVYPSFAPHLDRANAAPWAGLRPMSADGVPRIGRLGFDNLYVNTGHGHLGWTLAAGSGRLLADLLLGKPPQIDAAPYAAQRA